MNIIEIIEDKKVGKELSYEQINWWIKSLIRGEIADYQTSALLMAMTIKGLSTQESYFLTMAMANSGEMLDLSKYASKTADKHSSGGVGDSTTFVILPIIVACGMIGAKMSGRGLGFTGGTLDKIESIKGFNVMLTQEKFIELLDKNHMALAGQTSNICPADKILYALRDVTATVDCLGLIASSIMSKKLASGAYNIVLDVKCGRGAFVKNVEDAEKLARLMVDIGKKAQRNICAVITNMDCPLSNYIGNSLEVYGALEVLSGRNKGDLYDVSVFLATKLLQLGGIKNAHDSVIHALESGKALKAFREMVVAQGGNAEYVDNPQLLLTAKYEYDIIAQKDGYLCDIDAIAVAKLCKELGGGRTRVEDNIDLAVGCVIIKSIGDFVKKGDIIVKISYNRSSDVIKITQSMHELFVIDNHVPKNKQLIIKVVE